jgi:hypothetical protein
MNRLTNILQTLLIVLVVTLLYRGCHHFEDTIEMVTHTDTVWRDTIIVAPQPTAIIPTGGTVMIPYVWTEHDTVRLPGDTITMEVPVEQKRYDDSLYTAYVSGYHPQLDSIRLHIPSTITETIITQCIAPPRLSIGIQTGAGYGIISHKADIYLGIGA